MTASNLALVARALDDPGRTLEVWSGCTHTLTVAEELVVASPTFQRLRRLRQMGLAFHAWPNAENTRASHSFGVAFWSARYLDALHDAPDPKTRKLLASARTGLDGLSLDVALRLFGLLHDIDLLPLGHTLRYQSGLFQEGPGHPRLAACAAAIGAHASGPPDFARHLDAAAAALAGEASPHGRLMTEIVNSGLGADLVDFALRDSFAIARPQSLYGELAGALRLVDTDEGCGLALDVTDATVAARMVAIADDLYLARHEVFAASVFHPVKLAADAMFDLALRRLGPGACRALLPEEVLLSIGDDELVTRVAPAEAAAADRLGTEALTAALQAGRLHEEVWRTDGLAAFRARPEAERALSLDPAWRDDAETAICARLPWAAPGDVIVAVSPPAMQAKPANARFVGPGGAVFTLAEASEHGYDTRAGETAARYGRLWSLRVYLSPRRRERAPATVAAAEAVLGGKG